MFQNFSFQEFLSAFIVLFAVIDITGSIPIVMGMRDEKRVYSSLGVSGISLAILICFLYVGQGLLGLFGVDISSFAVAGGLVLLVLAVEMLFGIQVFKDDGPNSSATIVPLVFPLVAGPAVLTTLLSLRAEYSHINIILACIVNIIIVYVVLEKVYYVERLVGKQGIYILRKFFGIILLAMSVKLVASNIAFLLTSLTK